MHPRKHYADELEHEMVALAMAGQSVASLVGQFEPTSATIHSWIRKAREDVELIEEDSMFFCVYEVPCDD